MKRLFYVLMFGTTFLGCSKNDKLIVGGDILLEYSHNMNSSNETRHTFIDQGTKFDKVYDASGSVIKEFIYQGNNITEVIVQVEEGTDHYSYEYTDEDITRIIIDQIRNGITTTELTDYVYDVNNISVFSATDPTDLFKERYTFNTDGRISMIEFYDLRSGDIYDWFIRIFEYTNQGQISGLSDRIGAYDSSTETYFVEDFLGGGWSYFEDVGNPLLNAFNGAYLVGILAPEIFNDVIFGNGYLGNSEHNFVTIYSYAYDIQIVEYHIIRRSNIVIQTNGLPKSGLVGFGSRPFEFTYAE